MSPLVDDAELDAFVAAGQAAWPAIRVAPDAFVRFVRARMISAEDLATMPAADLYLACACADGDPAAIAAFECRYLADVDLVAGAMRAPPAAADEVKQVLRTRFFVPSAGRPPAIAEFGGRGDLHGWVRVSAVREVLRLYRSEKRARALEEALFDELAPAVDPETAAVKARCRAELATAIRAAVAALEPRARTLLRYQIVDGLGVTAIGAIFRVHRATAARWLADVREALVADTQRRLAERMHLAADEVASVIRLVRSQLDLSLASLLD